jgi:hypothetical protein
MMLSKIGRLHAPINAGSKPPSGEPSINIGELPLHEQEVRPRSARQDSKAGKYGGINADGDDASHATYMGSAGAAADGNSDSSIRASELP